MKSTTVSLTVLGTTSLITALRESPLWLASLLSCAVALTLAVLLVRSGLGYYNHALKIVIVIVLFFGAAFFFWDFLKARSTPD
jgi:hypothetical protein